MLVLIDESGDTGFKFDRGSSRFFVVTAVCFRDRDAAYACEAAIAAFRRSQSLSERFGFHFSKTPPAISLGLLRTAAAFDFTVVTAAVDKPIAPPGSPTGNELHLDLTARALRGLPDLDGATVVIDGKKAKPLQSQIERRLKAINAGQAGRVLRRIKFQRSEANDLLQLADAVSGAVYLALFRGDETFRTVVRKHERFIDPDE